MEKQNSVQSLERAFGIMETMAQKPEGMQLTEIANLTGLHKSTAHRLLGSLTSLGYVRKLPDGGKYRLTLKLLELSGRISDNIDVLGIAKPYLEELRDRVGETVHLVVRDQQDIVYIFKAESRERSFHMFSRIGMRREMYCTAAGKSMLAAMSNNEVAQLWKESDIKAYTDNTITSLETLLTELERVRRLGYAVDNEENELGVRCIAAALTEYSGRSTAAFSISAPIVRMGDERLTELGREVLAAKAKICGELGWRG